LLAVVALVVTSAAVNDSKIKIDPLVAKDVKAAFQEALKDEEPLLKEEIQKSQRLNTRHWCMPTFAHPKMLRSR
jgi:hypothetical protein